MRYRNKLINTVDHLIMSTLLLNYLIQLRHQTLKGAYFAYFWSNSRPPGPAHLLTTGPTYLVIHLLGWSSEITLIALFWPVYFSKITTMFRVVIPIFFDFSSVYTQHLYLFLNHHLTDLGRLYTRGFVNITSTSEALIIMLFDWWITLGIRAFFVSGKLLGHQQSWFIHGSPDARCPAPAWRTHLHSSSTHSDRSLFIHYTYYTHIYWGSHTGFVLLLLFKNYCYC